MYVKSMTIERLDCVSQRLDSFISSRLSPMTVFNPILRSVPRSILPCKQRGDHSIPDKRVFYDFIPIFETSRKILTTVLIPFYRFRIPFCRSRCRRVAAVMSRVNSWSVLSNSTRPRSASGGKHKHTTRFYQMAELARLVSHSAEILEL